MTEEKKLEVMRIAADFAGIIAKQNFEKDKKQLLSTFDYFYNYLQLKLEAGVNNAYEGG